MGELSLLSPTELVQEFRLATLENMRSIYTQSDADTSLASGVRLESIYRELDSRGEDSLVLLKELLKDTDDNVKSYAAISVFKFDREAALAALREVKQAGGFAGFAASIRLDDYENRLEQRREGWKHAL
jgi:hypothetical protein